MKGKIGYQVEGFTFKQTDTREVTVDVRQDAVVHLKIGVQVPADRVRRLTPRLRRALVELAAAVVENACRTNCLAGDALALRDVIDVKAAVEA